MSDKSSKKGGAPKPPRVPVRALGAAAGALAVAGGIGWLGLNSFFTVEGGHRGIVFNRWSGIKDKVYNEGLNFNVPWLEVPYIFYVRTRPRLISSLTGSRDLQMVKIQLRILTEPQVDKLPEIYRTLGPDYDEVVLPSIANEVLKQVIAEYNAPQLTTQREQVSAKILRNLTERARDFSINVRDVSITDLQFGAEFKAAVEAKQVAQQDAERARYLVEKAMQDKRSIIIKAQAEARTAELIGEAVKTNPGFVQLRRIDTAKEIAETVSRSANTVYLSADNLLLNLLDTSSPKEQRE